jgi:hypothetical protein
MIVRRLFPGWRLHYLSYWGIFRKKGIGSRVFAPGEMIFRRRYKMEIAENTVYPEMGNPEKCGTIKQ